MKFKCEICGKEYEKYDKPRKGKHQKIKRPYKSVTCSKGCSRERNNKIWRKE